MPPLTGWAAIRAHTTPQVALTSVFGTPYPQPLAVDGWEDGIFISRDGLHLFAVYVPADLLSFTIDGGDQTHAASYLRGPTFGMDLTTNPASTTTWLQGDIIHATRASTSAPFSAWHLSASARATYSEGAVVAQAGSGNWDLFVYTSNDHATDYKPHIVMLHNAAIEPTISAGPTFLPAPVTSASTAEDNPHLERLDATHLVLMFDSDDRVGGLGLHDIWVATSADDGASWTTPTLVTTIDSAGYEEEQPHLYHSLTGTWWLYYTASNSANPKLSIFRAAQTTPGDWNSWGAPELVVGAGNAEGIGEPTLTANGDLSFVVVTKDPAGTATNRYDADPWFLPKLPSAVTRAEPGVALPLAVTIPVAIPVAMPAAR